MQFSPYPPVEVFIAGIAVVAVPHTIFLLPAIFAGSAGSRLRPAAVVLGMAIGFIMMVAMFSTFGNAFSVFNKYLRLFSAFIIIGMGAVLFDKDINQVYVNISSRIGNFWRKHEFLEKTKSICSSEGVPGGLLLGMAIGVIWVPFVGPALGGTLAYIYYAESVFDHLYSVFLLLAYSLGFSIPILIIAYSGGGISGRLKWFREKRLFFKKVAGIVLILTGLMVLFGIDKYLIRLASPYFLGLESDLINQYTLYVRHIKLYIQF